MKTTFAISMLSLIVAETAAKNSARQASITKGTAAKKKYAVRGILGKGSKSSKSGEREVEPDTLEGCMDACVGELRGDDDDKKLARNLNSCNEDCKEEYVTRGVVIPEELAECAEGCNKDAAREYEKTYEDALGLDDCMKDCRSADDRDACEDECEDAISSGDEDDAEEEAHDAAADELIECYAECGVPTITRFSSVA